MELFKVEMNSLAQSMKKLKGFKVWNFWKVEHSGHVNMQVNGAEFWMKL